MREVVLLASKIVCRYAFSTLARCGSLVFRLLCYGKLRGTGIIIEKSMGVSMPMVEVAHSFMCPEVAGLRHAGAY